MYVRYIYKCVYMYDIHVSICTHTYINIERIIWLLLTCMLNSTCLLLLVFHSCLFSSPGTGRRIGNDGSKWLCGVSPRTGSIWTVVPIQSPSHLHLLRQIFQPKGEPRSPYAPAYGDHAICLPHVWQKVYPERSARVSHTQAHRQQALSLSCLWQKFPLPGHLESALS